MVYDQPCGCLYHVVARTMWLLVPYGCLYHMFVDTTVLLPNQWNFGPNRVIADLTCFFYSAMLLLSNDVDFWCNHVVADWTVSLLIRSICLWPNLVFDLAILLLTQQCFSNITTKSNGCKDWGEYIKIIHGWIYDEFSCSWMSLIVLFSVVVSKSTLPGRCIVPLKFTVSNMKI